MTTPSRVKLLRRERHPLTSSLQVQVPTCALDRETANIVGLKIEVKLSEEIMFFVANILAFALLVLLSGGFLGLLTEGSAGAEVRRWR